MGIMLNSSDKISTLILNVKTLRVNLGVGGQDGKTRESTEGGGGKCVCMPLA